MERFAQVYAGEVQNISVGKPPFEILPGTTSILLAETDVVDRGYVVLLVGDSLSFEEPTREHWEAMIDSISLK